MLDVGAAAVCPPPRIKLLLLLMAEAPQPLCAKDAAQRGLVGVVRKWLGSGVEVLSAGD